MSAPDRSLEQRFEALHKANAIRIYRAKLKRDIKAGIRDPVAVIRKPEQQLSTMKVIEVLLAMPKVGRTKANKWMQNARVSPSKTLGGLSDRQRVHLSQMAAHPVDSARQERDRQRSDQRAA